jgi:hypothetical protein
MTGAVGPSRTPARQRGGSLGKAASTFTLNLMPLCTPMQPGLRSPVGTQVLTHLPSRKTEIVGEVSPGIQVLSHLRGFSSKGQTYYRGYGMDYCCRGMRALYLVTSRARTEAAFSGWEARLQKMLSNSSAAAGFDARTRVYTPHQPPHSRTNSG